MTRPVGATVRTRTVHVIVPGDIDDPTRPSGGNTYDRRICLGLPTAGRPVRELAVAGGWPQPADDARVELARVLAGVPDGADVLIDGLVACGVPDVVVPHARRLRLAVLVHLPLGDEAGLGPSTAADLIARERATLRTATVVVATSPWAGRRITAVHGIPADRVRVAAPGVDPAPLAPGSVAGSRLLCVGSITPTKGQDVLVDALARIADLDWTCLLVGPPARNPVFAAAVTALVDRHGLADRVRFAGPRTGPALDAGYAGADLLVLPSRAETYGMVVTEALARGIPVLAAAVDGVPETLGRTRDGRRPGLLVPPADPPALAAALADWLGHPNLRHTTRGAARERRADLGGWEVTSRCLAQLWG